MSEIQLKATSVEDKPVRIGDLPIIKTNILENARQMDKGVVGGYNGAFPLTAASEGGIYLLPSTGKFYVCETAYNGAQISAPNSNFVELSVWKNHDRLANLIGYYTKNFPAETKEIDIFSINNNFDYAVIAITFYESKNSFENSFIIKKNENKTFRLNIQNVTAIYCDYESSTGKITPNSQTNNVNFGKVAILFFK